MVAFASQKSASAWGDECDGEDDALVQAAAAAQAAQVAAEQVEEQERRKKLLSKNLIIEGFARILTHYMGTAVYRNLHC